MLDFGYFGVMTSITSTQNMSMMLVVLDVQ